VDVKPLNPELDGDAHAIDECLVFHHIVGHAKVQLNHVEEPVSHRGDQHYASLDPVESATTIEIHAPVLQGDGGGAASQTIQP
jgi:hypothetical protein